MDTGVHGSDGGVLSVSIGGLESQPLAMVLVLNCWVSDESS